MTSMIREKLIVFVFSTLFFSCNNTASVKNPTVNENTPLQESKDTLVEQSLIKNKHRDSTKTIERSLRSHEVAHNNGFVNIEDLSDDFVLDMRYATTNNFLKEKVYSCSKCFIRIEVVQALIDANNDLIKKGYRIKLFDCYRPHSVQKKMWKIYPNPGYVADPKGGSIHNKGAAVDISLVQLDGSTVDMGTDFDDFGKKAHHSYSKLPKQVLRHRRLLRSTMEKHGFKIIRTEWWHYNFIAGKKFKISDFRWECD